MNNNFKLSFCIPTYNNEKSVRRLVLDLLNFNNSNIEVVVLDNGSIDNTLNTLNLINDSRLHIYSNGINKGALFNMLNVLDKGTGDYLVYCTDHDHVDISKINDLLTFFEKNSNVSFGYCEYIINPNQVNIIYNKGFDSLKNMAYITRHPTGYFFKKNLLKKLDITINFSNYDFVDLFPLEFIFAELSILGNGVIYKDNIFKPETGDRVVQHKSATTSGYSKSAFFAPECRLKLALNFRSHILSLPITKAQKNELIINSFYRELNAAIFFYRQVLGDEKLCIHYQMNKKFIGRLDMLTIAIKFCMNYFKKLRQQENMFILLCKIFKLQEFSRLTYRLAFK
jgi:glycosyltransferase involved in cell wall biosynthesis